jgi:hypothetical protein
MPSLFGEAKPLLRFGFGGVNAYASLHRLRQSGRAKEGRRKSEAAAPFARFGFGGADANAKAKLMQRSKEKAKKKANRSDEAKNAKRRRANDSFFASSLALFCKHSLTFVKQSSTCEEKAEKQRKSWIASLFALRIDALHCFFILQM